MMNTYFPNPSEHASILLDVFSGDVQRRAIAGAG